MGKIFHLIYKWDLGIGWNGRRIQNLTPGEMGVRILYSGSSLKVVRVMTLLED